VKIWKVILAVVVIFGAGFVTGGLLVRTQERRNVKPPPAVPGGPPGSGLWGVSRTQFVDKMNRHLDLTPEQCGRIDKIMKESHDRMAKLWEPIAPLARQETKNVREQIFTVLTPGQCSKFDEVFKPKNKKDRSSTNTWESRKTGAVKECCAHNAGY
jgi:Spy/CpxP family protein refolding chaperone